MTPKEMNKPLDKYLRRLHLHAQTVEATVRKMVEDTTLADQEAKAAEADFAVFAASWTAMLLIVKDAADETGIDLAVFASSLADLLLTINALASSNEELREMMQTSIANKVSNAILISQNLEWLNEVTPGLIANQITMVRSESIMTDAIIEVNNRGEPATLRLKWLAKILKELGY